MSTPAFRGMWPLPAFAARPLPARPSMRRLGVWPPGGSSLMCAGGPKPRMTAVGFEPTQLALVELESTPLDHSGKLS